MEISSEEMLELLSLVVEVAQQRAQEETNMVLERIPEIVADIIREAKL